MPKLECNNCTEIKDSDKNEIGTCPVCLDVFCNNRDCFELHCSNNHVLSLVPFNEKEIKEMQEE
jgi:hypothetical protein